MGNKYFIIGLSGLVIGLSAVLLYKSAPPEAKLPSLIWPTPTPVTLQLPAKAAPSALGNYQGQLSIIPWDKVDPVPAASASALYQGDELITGNKSSAVFDINGISTISIQENAYLLLASLMPDRLALRQKSGVVSYSLLSATPLSVTAGRSLLKISSGQATVNMADQITRITMSSGSATLGYNDNLNITGTWLIDKDTPVTVNDITGKVRLTNRR